MTPFTPLLPIKSLFLLPITIIIRRHDTQFYLFISRQISCFAIHSCLCDNSCGIQFYCSSQRELFFTERRRNPFFARARCKAVQTRQSSIDQKQQLANYRFSILHSNDRDNRYRRYLQLAGRSPLLQHQLSVCTTLLVYFKAILNLTARS